MAVKKLSELAGTIRSKNAGVNQITFDIIFGDEETYRKVIKSGALKKEAMASLYGISLERMSSFVEFDPANAIKFTIYRLVLAGAPVIGISSGVSSMGRFSMWRFPGIDRKGARVMVKLISDEEVARCLDYRTVMVAIEQAFESLACGRATIHARQRIDCGDVKLSSMGAIWLDANLAGEKVYPTIKGQFTFLYNLFDTRTGAALAVMQANELTRFRTPALTTLAVSHAAAATRKLALFGAGLQGRAHLECLVSALPFDQVDVVDLVDVSAWCADVGRKFGVAVRQVVWTKPSRMPTWW